MPLQHPQDFAHIKLGGQYPCTTCFKCFTQELPACQRQCVGFGMCLSVSVWNTHHLSLYAGLLPALADGLRLAGPKMRTCCLELACFQLQANLSSIHILGHFPAPAGSHCQSATKPSIVCDMVKGFLKGSPSGETTCSFCL